MRKIIFGIVIPLIVIVVLAILGSVETGFSVDNNYLKEISVKEEFRIYVEPSYIFQRQNYSELVEAYRNYDKLVVYEREKNGRYYYDQCGSLDEDILEEGVKIDLVF